MSTEDRVLRLENAFSTLIELAQRSDERLTRIEAAQERSEQIVSRLATLTLDRFEETDKRIDALIDSQVRLGEAQGRTDESLRNLIAVVDRYFSEGRNGKS